MAQLGSLIVTGTSRFLNSIYGTSATYSSDIVVGDNTNKIQIVGQMLDIGNTSTWDGSNTLLKPAIQSARSTVLQKYSPSNGIYNILTSGVASNTQDETTFTNKAYYLKYDTNLHALTLGSRKADTTSGSYSLSAGYNNTASGSGTSSLGYNCVSSGDYSFSCGYTCTASNSSAFAGGYMSTASGSDAFAFGSSCTSSGQFSVSFGNECTATNTNSYAEGYSCECNGSYSHAEGFGTKVTSNSSFSHAEGYYSETSHSYTHAEGYSGKAKGEASHAEGFRTEASGIASHSEGYDTVASGYYSHAQGYSNTANHRSQHVFGEYCVTDPSPANSADRGTYIEIVGNGGPSTNRSNARTLDWSGNEVLAGNLTLAGTTSDVILTGTSNTWDGTNTSLKSAFDNTKMTKTATGNPIELTDAASAPMVRCETAITGSQDLHGQDKPWVGGAGKNKLPMTISGIKALNTTGTWNGNTYTLNGITFTIETDNAENITGFTANASSAATNVTTLILYRNDNSSCPYIGDYLSGCTGGSVTTYDLRLSDVTVGATANYSGSSQINITATGKWSASILIRSGYTPQNLKFYPMIRLASVADSTFAPYSNICPITAYSTGEIVESGKNLCNKNDFNHTSTLKYKPMFVGDGTFTMSTNCPPTGGGQEAYRDIFFLPGNVNSGASSSTNGVIDSTPITCESIGGYVTVASRYNTVRNDPLNYNWQIEKGSVPTPYEPYVGTTHTTTFPSAIYRGSEDVVNGEVTTQLVKWTRNSATMNNAEGYPGWNDSGIANIIGHGVSGRYTAIMSVGSQYAVNTLGNNDTLFLPTDTYGLTQTEWIALAVDIDIVIELPTPTTSPVTPTNLPIKSLSGYNHITSSTGDMEVEYIREGCQAIVDLSESSRTYFGTCSTGASTNAKVIVCPEFTTSMANCPVGTTIKVHFTNGCTATAPTLNVNSKGAVNIYSYGTTIGLVTWRKNSIVTFTYDGTCWRMNDVNDFASLVQRSLLTSESADYFYPMIGNNHGSNSNYASLFTNGAFRIAFQTGTTTTEGAIRLDLGNNTAAGTDGNSTGKLRIYGNTNKYGTFIVGNLTDNRTYTFPNKTGTVALTSDIPTTESSIKVKKNISAISDEEVNSILKLNAVKFDFKSCKENNAIHRGFIAEDVAKILPNLVTDEVVDDDGNLVDPARLNYMEMIPYLVEVCKRQQKEIAELKSLIRK